MAYLLIIHKWIEMIAMKDLFTVTYNEDLFQRFIIGSINYG